MASTIGRLKPHVPASDTITRQDIAALQDAVKRVIDEVALDRRAFLSGEHLEDLTLATGNTTIYHKLGRKCRGWMRTGGTALGVGEVSKDATKLVLSASTGGTISLIVF